MSDFAVTIPTSHRTAGQSSYDHYIAIDPTNTTHPIRVQIGHDHLTPTEARSVAAALHAAARLAEEQAAATADAEAFRARVTGDQR